VIKINKATTPIYFKNVFYVRNGPSSDPLDLPDAVNYIIEHFETRKTSHKRSISFYGIEKNNALRISVSNVLRLI